MAAEHPDPTLSVIPAEAGISLPSYGRKGIELCWKDEGVSARGERTEAAASVSVEVSGTAASTQLRTLANASGLPKSGRSFNFLGFLRRGSLVKALVLFLALSIQTADDNLPAPAKSARPILNGKPTDYPLSAMRKHEEGDVGFQILVDASGTPIACRVTLSSGHPDLDNQTCTDMEQMIDRFEPAQNSNGVAIKSVYSSTMHWRLPDGR